MYPSELIPNALYWGRASWKDTRHDGHTQSRRLGSWHSMSNPADVWAEGVRQHHLVGHEKDVWVDVLPTQGGRDVKPLYSIQVKKYLGLGTTPEPATDTTPSSAMSPSFTPIGHGMPAANMPSAITMAPPVPMEYPTTPQEFGKFMMQHQNNSLQTAQLRVYELQQLLIQEQGEKATLQRKVDMLDLDLKHKDREYEHKLIEAKREIRGEYEDREPKPSGLSGLAEAVTNPQHPLAGLVGLFATKLLGGDPGAAGASAASDGTMGGHSKNMTDILNGLAELIPNDEFGVKLYTSLSKILAHPQGLDTLIQMGNGIQPELANA